MSAPVFRESSERNKRPILDTLRSLLPDAGAALEIASGTGQHVEWFAQHLPGWNWQPSDTEEEALSVIDERMAQAGLGNVRGAARINVLEPPWPLGPGAVFDLVFCCNMLHVAPAEACKGLMQGSAAHLRGDGKLIVYGPFFEADRTPEPSNVAFDQSLRSGDPQWGIRWLHDVAHEADLAGLVLKSRFAMPANNLLLVWARTA